MTAEVLISSISPTEYKECAQKYNIIYGYEDCPFGICLIGISETDKAVLYLSFVNKTKDDALKELGHKWPYSKLTKDETNATSKIVESIFNYNGDHIHVLLKGTEFQVKVWRALTTIPTGESFTYEKVAHIIENPKAVRAVGNAISKNKIGYLIPCHRVKGKTGSDKFGWGVELKHEMLKYESEQKK